VGPPKNRSQNLADREGFSPSQRRRISDILLERRDHLLERWKETFEEPSDE
jgi:hypothetical protein